MAEQLVQNTLPSDTEEPFIETESTGCEDTQAVMLSGECVGDTSAPVITFDTLYASCFSKYELRQVKIAESALNMFFSVDGEAFNKLIEDIVGQKPTEILDVVKTIQQKIEELAFAPVKEVIEKPLFLQGVRQMYPPFIYPDINTSFHNFMFNLGIP